MDDQGLDDLFGDTLADTLNEEQIQQQLEIGVAVPAPPGLGERIEALQLGGCNDKIAWSKSGVIANITKDNKNVRLCTLTCRSDTGEWVKSSHTDNQFISQIRMAFKMRDIAHVSWNPFAPDLLVADSCGRIVLFTPLVAINRPVSTKVFAREQDDSLSALVGLIWINQKRPMRLNKGSIRVDGHWRHQIAVTEPSGPFCLPSIPPGGSRSAFIAVTRRSTIVMGYQPPQAQGYTDVKHDLEGFTNSADALTHAALCPYKDDKILLVTHTESRKILLYSLKINWNQANPSQPPTHPPTVESQHLTTIDSCYPSTDSHWTLPLPSLAKVDIIPRSYMDKNATANPMIMATFMERDTTDNRLPIRTILSRWELREEKPVIDPSFSSASAKTSSSTELKLELALHRLEDVSIDRVILNMQLLQHNETWAMCSSDGVVEFRDRRFEILPMDDNPDKLSGLPQLGFALTNQRPCQSAPVDVVKAYMGKDHEVEIAVMQLPVEMIDLGTIATMEKITITLVIANVIAEIGAGGNSTNDDIIMMTTKFMYLLSEGQKTFFHDLFLKETYKTLGMADKLADRENFERTIRSGIMTKCHSLQAALGNRGEEHERTIPSKLALMALNLKSIYVAFTMAVMSTTKPSAAGSQGGQAAQVNRQEILAESDLNRADVLQCITNLTGWYMKLTDYLIDQLFGLNRILDVTDGDVDMDVLRLRIFASNSPAIPLLLCNYTRSLLRRCFSSLHHLGVCTQMPCAWPPSPTASSWDGFRKIVLSPCVPPPTVDILLNELDERCKKDFADAGTNDGQRQECELDLMVRGVVPDVLMPVVGWLLTQGVEKLRGNVQQSQQHQQHQQSSTPLPSSAEADLAFSDWSVLGLTEDVRSRRWHRDTIYDGVQKKELGQRATARARMRDGSLRIRSCTRCGTHMEDQMLPKSKDAKIPNIFALFRACFCGAHFVTIRPEDIMPAKKPEIAM